MGLDSQLLLECITQAAGRKGKSEAFIKERLSALESLLPDLINLHKVGGIQPSLLVSPAPGGSFPRGAADGRLQWHSRLIGLLFLILLF